MVDDPAPPAPLRTLVDLAVSGELPADPAAALHAALDAPAPADRPYALLAFALDLTPPEVLLLRLAAAIEEDLALGRRVAERQRPVGGSRVTAGLAAALLAPFGGGSVSATLRGAAFESGVLILGAPEAPLAERPIAVPAEVLHALDGHPTGRPDPATLPALGPEQRRQAHAYGAAIAGTDTVLVVRTPHRAEALAAAREIARAGHAELLVVDPAEPGLAARLALAGAWPVLLAEAGPGATTRVHPPPRHGGPVLVAAGVDGGVEGPVGRPVTTWRVPVPTLPDRAALWSAALDDPRDAAALAAHRHRAGRIHDLARLARVPAALAGRDGPTAEDVHRVAREGHDAVGQHAQLLPERVADEALVLGEAVRAELEALLARARHREALPTTLGPSARTRYRAGLRALLTGPSGTGKTLAVGWLATRLGLPLFRVDPSSVVSKYIGETEQNLAELLARAESAEVLLFFDEADSLFGKRTDVQHSTDRFANAQTNYLLQRIETYEGLVVLASNSKSHFDAAFTRRLDVIVNFPPPSPVERRALWQAHLAPGALPVPALNALATGCDLAGGHIRNAVLAAAVRAREARRPLHLGDLVDGLAQEYRKLGKVLPHSLLSLGDR